MNKNYNMPDGARQIIKTLYDHGYEAYIVGGSVRDMILGRTPEDWDITTSAHPDEIKKLFRRTVDTGIQHGTVTVLLGNESYEVTTYRVDGDYADHRHPDGVIFTPNLHEDLKRRDFTINAMAYNDDEGLIDCFGGRQDLEAGIIRCVGDPMERFDEDALRMLRCIRFAGQLSFDIEPDTLNAIKNLSQTLVHVSAERIRTELTKLLVSDNPTLLKTAMDVGLTKHFLPEFDKMMECEQNNPHHCYTVGEHSMRVVVFTHDLIKAKRQNGEAVDKKQETALCYAALLHDIAKPECKKTDENGIDHFHGHDVMGEEMSAEIIRRLKFDNDTLHMVKCLVRNHDARYPQCYNDTQSYAPAGKRSMRRLINKVGRDMIPLLFILQEADILAQSEYERDEKLKVLAAGKACASDVFADNDAVHISELKITGRDLIDEKGYEPGPGLGKKLAELLEMVMDDPSLNTRERLLALVDSEDKM